MRSFLYFETIPLCNVCVFLYPPFPSHPHLLFHRLLSLTSPIHALNPLRFPIPFYPLTPSPLLCIVEIWFSYKNDKKNLLLSLCFFCPAAFSPGVFILEKLSFEKIRAHWQFIPGWLIPLSSFQQMTLTVYTGVNHSHVLHSSNVSVTSYKSHEIFFVYFFLSFFSCRFLLCEIYALVVFFKLNWILLNNVFKLSF